VVQKDWRGTRKIPEQQSTMARFRWTRQGREYSSSTRSSKSKRGPCPPGPLLLLWLKRTKEETERYLVCLVWVERTGSTSVSLCEFL
jgi:hypothetical protein